jgi:predicted nucleic acid-binding protein
VRLYLDTNILIALNEGEGPRQRLLEILLVKGFEKGIRFSTSALTFSELLVRPYRDNKLELARAYHALANGADWLEILPVTPAVLDRAAVIRARASRIKLPDAIHLASASQDGCDYVLSADLGLVDLGAFNHPLFKGGGTKPLTILRPDEPSLTSLIESLTA